MKNIFASFVVAARLLAQTPDPAPVVVNDPAIAAVLARIDAGRIDADVKTLVGFGTRHTLSETTSPDRGIGAARRFVAASLEKSLGRDAVALHVHVAPISARVPKPTELVNVVATIPGEDPKRVVVISGHYDSMPGDVMDAVSDAPGANDDASGTAVVMECARVLAGLKPKATILLALTAGEEQGLLGAAFLAARLKEEEREVVFMTTNDIVGGARGSNGRLEPNVLRCFSEGVPSGPKDAQGRVTREVVGSDNDAPSRQVARYIAERAPIYLPGFEVRLIFRRDRFLRGGDHKAFNDLGFAAVRLTEPNENWDGQHRDVKTVDGRRFGDTPDRLVPAYMKNVAAVNLAAALEAALGPPPPRDVRVDVLELGPDTTLRWRTPEASVDRVAILTRRTHEPTWTGRRLVKKGANEASLEGFSKDDWLFAVENVDGAGRRSIPVYPTPTMRPRR